jgi:hypothetical protein
VRDLVQHGIPHLVDAVQKSERPRQRDPLVRVITPPKPPPRVIELKRPPQRFEAVFPHELLGEVRRFVEVHVMQVLNARDWRRVIFRTCATKACSNSRSTDFGSSPRRRFVIQAKLSEELLEGA